MCDALNHSYDALSYNAIVWALMENYESIYVVDAKTYEFKCFHESDSYSSLCIEQQGKNFFDAMENNILDTIYYEDQDFVRNKLSPKAILSSLSKEKFYSFVYRLNIDGKPLYHKLRVTIDNIEGRPHFLIGIRNVDASFRQDKALAEKLSLLHSKELSHLEAILASSAGYLEANISKDIVLEFQSRNDFYRIKDEIYESVENRTLSYSAFLNWQIGQLSSEDKRSFMRIGNRDYLINCFKRNEMRASVPFSMEKDGEKLPCKIVFYLYQDATSGDILSFCVLYDLTEQQRKEKELEELEHKLQMSRLSNFTSQMQPHFLYNALGSIQEIVLTDPLYAYELIGDFTTHLRSCIRAMSSDSPISFMQELENIKAYVNIEKLRFGEKLKVIYDLQVTDFRILPLSIQPIVENAIRHGIYERGKEGGTVSIKTTEDEKFIRIIIEDNGVGFDVDAFNKSLASGETDSTGLNNIMFRLDKMINASVKINSKIGIGTTVIVIVPKGEG